MMRLLKYIILVLIVWNLPGFILVQYSIGISSPLSYLTFLLLLVYYWYSQDRRWVMPFILLGLFYYLIAGLDYSGSDFELISDMIKYFVVVICGVALVRTMSAKELFIFLGIGAISVLIHAVFFGDDYGRYSGFYLNPNSAGFICLMGYGLTYAIEEKKLRTIGRLVFTFAGLLTFSRTFVVLWLLLNLISLRISIRNVRILAIGVVAFVLLFTFAEVLQLNVMRFNQLKGIFDSSQTIRTRDLSEDSRTETWSIFYDNILEYPILGNGYRTFQGNSDISRVGVHNSFLMVIGEAGFIPFFILLGIYIYMLYHSYKLFDKDPSLLMIAIGLSFFLLANHNFFTTYYLILISLWLHVRIRKLRQEIDTGKKTVAYPTTNP